MVLLENDVRDLADAQTYLDPNDPKSALATDLLLGTQGWRRFATVDTNKFISTFGDLAHRVLADVQPVQPIEFGGPMGGGGFGGGARFDFAGEAEDRIKTAGAVAAPAGVVQDQAQLQEKDDVQLAARRRGATSDASTGR
jgi:hypothetical protein